MKNNRGIALLLVIWMLAALIAIVTAFSFSAKAAALSTMHMRDDVKRSFLAEAGVEYGIMRVFHRRNNIEAPDVWKIDGASYEKETAGGIVRVRILDESGRVDINKTSPVILKILLERAGVPSEKRDIIADSMEDWRDEDNLHRLNGAEDDYYMSLPRPYKAKNGDFDTVEELLLVRGMTGEILYGWNGKKGLIDFLTVHSDDGKINIYSAPREVLASMPGMTEEGADAIMNMRKDLDIGGMQKEIASSLARYSDGNTYSIEAGSSNEEAPGIRAVVKITGADRYRILYWNDRMLRQ